MLDELPIKEYNKLKVKKWLSVTQVAKNRSFNIEWLRVIANG